MTDILNSINNYEFTKYGNLFDKDENHYIDLTYYGNLAESYISSGDSLLSCNGDKYIILYLYRHSIELDIKMLLSYHIYAELGNNRSVFSKDMNLLKKHNLISLFNCFCRYCGDTSRFAKHNKVISKIISNFSYYEVDENSYRYPYYRKHHLNGVLFDINKVQQFTHEFHSYCMYYMSVSGYRLDIFFGYSKYRVQNTFKSIIECFEIITDRCK